MHMRRQQESRVNLIPKLQNGALARSKRGLFWLGMIMSFIGLWIVGFEAYRMTIGLQDFIRWKPFWLGIGLTIFGSFLVYKLDPFAATDKALQIAQEITAVLARSRLPGGDRRGFDPPATNEHEIEVAQEVKRRRRSES